MLRDDKTKKIKELEKVLKSVSNDLIIAIHSTKGKRKIKCFVNSLKPCSVKEVLH